MKEKEQRLKQTPIVLKPDTSEEDTQQKLYPKKYGGVGAGEMD